MKKPADGGIPQKTAAKQTEPVTDPNIPSTYGEAVVEPYIKESGQKQKVRQRGMAGTQWAQKAVI